MKKLLIPLTAVLIGFSSATAGEYHDFKSADGSKRLEAKLISVASGTFHLQTRDGRKISAPAAAFCAEDTEYAKSVLATRAAGRNLALDIVEVEERKPGASKAVTSVTPVGYDLNLRNNGQIDLTGLTAKYQIHYTKDSGKGKTDQVLGGDLAIADLKPRAEAKIYTQKVKLSRTKKACVGGT